MVLPLATFIASVLLISLGGSPVGAAVVRNGLGQGTSSLCLLFGIGISRALEKVPHGGAMCTYCVCVCVPV